MWACCRGHRDTAIILYEWNHTAINVRNHQAQTAIECAWQNNFHELADEIERLETSREKATMLLSKSQTTDDVFLHPDSVVRYKALRFFLNNDKDKLLCFSYVILCLLNIFDTA